MYARTDGWMDERTDGCMYVQMDGWIDSCIYVWIDGWMHVLMDRHVRMYAWTDGQTHG